MTETNLRPEVTDHLRRRLEAFREGFQHNLAMIGPPGSGKTFQLQLVVNHPPPHLLLIYCALYRESCGSFLRRFLAAVLQAGLQGDRLPLTSVHQSLEPLLRQLEDRLPKTVAAIRPIEGLLTKRLFGDAFGRALDLIPILTAECGRPCVLILDEFLFLEELGLAHAFHELGKRVMTWPHTLFILASSSCHRARMILRERLQLLFGQFELVTLDAIDPAILTTWVQRELKGVRGARAVSPFLTQWMGSYPWYLTVFLKRFRELAALGKQPDFTEVLFLQTAWDLLGSPEGMLRQWCVSKTEGLTRSRLGARAVEALMQIANGARTTTEIGKRIGRAGLPEALQLLVEHDLAKRNGMCWVVTDPILRCWLSGVLSAQRSEPGFPTAAHRQQFERYLRELWTHWMHTHQLSFSEQVVGLFAKFADETVSLDSKTGRLPKFQTIRTQRPESAAGTEAYLVAGGAGKHWCASVQEGPLDENAIGRFDAFCRRQTPKPSRKVVITKSMLDQNARLLAKAANMWVWGSDDLSTLMGLYGQI
ncbi:MAG: ATP-binding protein [Candidatus Omnitrophica bacterium]|nr:ATP-binding protein [Candidatus Omnitrophota bacterium]MBI3021566.1 ATP-binding protein [Candidatus Omnitrophota bacterium]